MYMKKHYTLTLTEKELFAVSFALWSVEPEDDNPEHEKALKRVKKKINKLGKNP